MQSRAISALAALLVGTAAPVPAQDPAAAMDGIFSSLAGNAPGCVVGAAHRSRVVAIRAYGLADVARGVPLHPGMQFDIGSTQKQFVAAVVLQLAEAGRLALTDDIRTYLPELPEYGHRITVNHLLTHTSGIRDWTGILPLAEEGREALDLILHQRGLNFVPGTEWSYSNSGFVLLREIVARVTGKPFPEVLRSGIFEPLGMHASAYVPDVHAGTGEVALAYEQEGATWRPFMRLGANRGGGALLSTAGDLLTWNEALTTGRLGAFVTAGLQETATLANGRRLNYARGLILSPDPEGTIVWHSGGAAGYSTWLGRIPEHGISVALLCNREPISATALAGRVADLFLPPPSAATEAAQARRAAESAGVPGLDISGRAGLFFDEISGEPMRLAVNGGRLQVVGGPPLVTLAPDRFRTPRGNLFFRSQDESELVFLTDDRIVLTSMEGEVTHYRRARSWTPSAEDLQALEGRYHSEDLGMVYELLPGQRGLVMRQEVAPEKSIELVPAEEDTFMLNLMMVRIQRDAAGRVTGFTYRNPVVQGLGFARLGAPRGG